MCGIAGVVRLDSPVAAGDVRATLRMLEAQVHRGPDDWGLLVPSTLALDPEGRSLLSRHGGEHVRAYPSSGALPSMVLGSRRLRVIDLSPRGRMPMGTADGRFWITYNGETYNYRDLRAELEGGGEHFGSDTDTEVILRGFGAWGTDVLQRLRGMFAVALFENGPEPRILLARDRFGIKPLYYYRRDGEVLVFASEVRALVRSGLVPDEENPKAFVRFLQLGSIPAPDTTIKNVSELPAGHCLSADAKGFAIRRYWDLAAHMGRNGGESTTAEASRTRALLEESVRLHLASDVPLGVFLSGGIDSSALVALAARLRGGDPITTLSVVFDERDYDERPYARTIADLYRTDHREVVFRDRELFESLPRIWSAMDQPTIDGVNSFVISEAARRAGLTVVLSGTGGDEVFLGYPHFRRVSALYRTEAALRPLGSAARAGLLGAGAGAAGLLGRRLDKLSYLERPSSESAYLLVRGLFTPAQIADLLGVEEREVHDLGPIWPELDTRQRPLDRFVLLEFHHYLQNQLLRDLDAMSMAHSIEARVPYLDHVLVEHAVALLPATKLSKVRPKPALLDAVHDLLPRTVWDRPKMGFTFPFEPWLRSDGHDLEADTLRDGRFERRAVTSVWASVRLGRTHWSRAWALGVLSSAARAYVTGAHAT
jgi:asparagine synthase (glutamine-hydrolysing)